MPDFLGGPLRMAPYHKLEAKPKSNEMDNTTVYHLNLLPESKFIGVKVHTRTTDYQLFNLWKKGRKICSCTLAELLGKKLHRGEAIKTRGAACTMDQV